MKKLAIISPCYNEEVILHNSCLELVRVLDNLKKSNKISQDSFLLLVDDGSSDSTWEKIKEANSQFKDCFGIRLASNVGHQNAIMAGMMFARQQVDAIITIDIDLQDDLSAISSMIDLHDNGAEIVYGVKVNRDVDSKFKYYTAHLFYKFQRICGINAIEHHADFRLLSRKVLDTLTNYNERNLYLRGIIPALGYKSETVEYVLKPRQAGSSKYTFRKMLALASDGITSFSIRPFYFIFYLGLFMMVISAIMVLYVIISLILKHFTPGWSSLMISLWFIGSVITMSIGVIGIYIGKIYIEVKHRPLYTIEEYIK